MSSDTPTTKQKTSDKPRSPCVEASIAYAENMTNALKVAHIEASTQKSPFRQIDVGGEMYVRKDDVDQWLVSQIGEICAATPSNIR